MDLVYPAFFKSASCKAYGIQSHIAERIPVSFNKRRNICPDFRTAADYHMAAYMSELMDHSPRTYDSPLINFNFTCQSCCIPKDTIVPNNAIMSNMGIRHNEAV